MRRYRTRPSLIVRAARALGDAIDKYPYLPLAIALAALYFVNS